MRGTRVEPAQVLELPAGPGFEAADARAHTVFDCRVVADVEVQEAQVFERAPVASVEDVVLADGQAAGDEVAVTSGEEEAEPLAPALLLVFALH